MNGGEVDYAELNKMVDTFIENGFNYFDTAHGYVGTKSEIAVRECLAKRYPRESFVLTDKLTNFYFKTENDVRPFFESQLKACGVEYFDLYLMHAQSKKTSHTSNVAEHTSRRWNSKIKVKSSISVFLSTIRQTC